MSHVLKLQKLNCKDRTLQMGDSLGELHASSFSTICPATFDDGITNPFEME